jgi:uncharacterized SAM-binding protein YcdF (DUF218 family)
MLAWAVLAAVLFLWPPRHVPNRADVLVVLAGARGPRLTRGLALVRRGVAPRLVISDAWSPTWVEANRLCAGRSAPVPVLCFHPDEYSTRGEAEAFTRLAAEHGWTSVLVVTSRYHIARARIMFERCFRGTVYTDGAQQSFVERLLAAPVETAKLAYALTLRRSC